MTDYMYTYTVLYSTLQMLSVLVSCTHVASWLTVYANKRSKPHIGLDA